MKIQLETASPLTLDTEALVTFAFEKDDPVDAALAELDRALAGRLKELVVSHELTGKKLDMVLLHYPAGLAAKRLLIVGAGKPEKFSATEMRRLAGAALRYLKGRSVKRLAFLLREPWQHAEAVQLAAEGLLLATVDLDKYKSEKKDHDGVEQALILGAGPDAQAALDRAVVIAESENWERDVANEPSNRLTPTMLAARAREMALESGLAVDILDEKQIEEMKMGGVLGVARGSAEPPRVIVLTYNPPQVKPGSPVVGLVGKAITFDTGGISIKPSKGMEKMKYDMCGGATMLAVMRAIARLKPSVKVVAVVPSSENMPGGRAVKPGDVLVSLSGKTIEVLNTDAEGRLVLADGLAYARRLGCTHLIDAATLTGAVVVALSTINVGVFGSNEAFTASFLETARAAGEKMWHMPLDDDYRDMMKSQIADLQNISSGDGGGASTAAGFLREFVGEEPWIHLDIAGTAWLDDAKPWMAKGASAVAVRTLVDFIFKQ
ncbi:MAG TPA: leucyl aminopeptidase [Candidatus Dormibacteraeota bacterium]|nr:leucyl aminopeptidase [Candidatus Dormibacteraeota bacterium]